MVSDIQRVGSKAKVMHGTALQTAGGLKMSDLEYTPRGRIVSKKKRALGLKRDRENPSVLNFGRAPPFTRRR